jgi:hypothetical protein
MQSAVVMWWQGVVPGREQAAVDLYHETQALFKKAVDEGAISDSAWYVGQPSMVLCIVRGEREDLRQVIDTPEWQSVIMRAGLVSVDFNVGWYQTGDEVDGLMDVWGQAAAQFG